MPDITWAPEVVEAIMSGMSRAGMCPIRAVDDRELRPLATAALSASPLPEALALIERLIEAASHMADSMAWDVAVADAAAFLARVKRNGGAE